MVGNLRFKLDEVKSDSHLHHHKKLSLPRPFQITFVFILISTGFMAFSRRQLEMVTHSELISQDYLFVIDTSAVIVSACLMPIAGYFAYHNPMWKHTWSRMLRRYFLLIGAHICIFVGCSSVVKYILFNLYDLPIPTLSVLLDLLQAEILGQVFLLMVVIVTVNAICFEQARLIKIEQNLAQEQLQSLQNQINPHFLFNTLNTISAMMYQDVEAADRMIERLSELLRASLVLGNSVEVTVEEELALLNAYTSIMQERFPSKFEVNVNCDPHLRELLVPPLLLQPLVENSIKHGQLDARHSTQEQGQVEVVIREQGHLLELCVLDNGDAHLRQSSTGVKASSTSAHEISQQGRGQVVKTNIQQELTSESPSRIRSTEGGVGLKVTRDRLRLLYGQEASITFGFRRDQAGYQVKVTLPLVTAQRGSSRILTRLPTPI